MIFNWLKRKLNIKPKYVVECDNCGYIRRTYESPSGGYTCPENSASRCTICNNNGGGVYGVLGGVPDYIDNSTKALIKRQKYWKKTQKQRDKENPVGKAWNKINNLNVKEINWKK